MIDIPDRDTIFFQTDDGKYISVERDQCPDNPRERYEGLGTFLTWQSRYASPDNNLYATPQDFVSDVLGEEVENGCHSMQDVLAAFDGAGYAIKGIYLLEHGEASYQLGGSNPFGDPWDSGPVGFAFVPPDTLVTEGIDKEIALRCLEGEMLEYNAYTSGEVFTVVLFDQEGDVTDRHPVYGLDSLESEFSFIEELPVGDESELFDYIQTKQEAATLAEARQARGTYYFSFGTSESFPFQNGWVEVKAENEEQACDLFRSHYPDRNKTLNCAFVYSSQEWQDTPMAKGGPGQACHQVISAPGPFHSEPNQLLGELIRNIKQRAAEKNAKDPKQATGRKSPEIEL